MKIIEASGRIGGRVRDNFSFGCCVGLGAMFITGVNNNPLTLLARQLGLNIQLINEDKCELISEQGVLPAPDVDKKVEGHFNKALDRLAEWRKSCTTEDVSLGGMCVRVLRRCLLLPRGCNLSVLLHHQWLCLALSCR